MVSSSPVTFSGLFPDALCNGVYVTPSRRASDRGRLGVVFVPLTHGTNAQFRALLKWTSGSTFSSFRILIYPCIHQVSCCWVYVAFVVHFLVFFTLLPLC